jgi:hypothetical protein
VEKEKEKTIAIPLLYFYFYGRKEKRMLCLSAFFPFCFFVLSEEMMSCRVLGPFG